MSKKKIVGAPIRISEDLGLIHEPVNEQGVVFVFAKLHKKLGVDYIQGIRGAFPDAFGIRKIGKGKYEPIDIEFKFESIDFKRSGYDPNECDILVCWEDNWKGEDRPKNLEIIELKSAIPKLLETEREIIRKKARRAPTGTLEQNEKRHLRNKEAMMPVYRELKKQIFALGDDIELNPFPRDYIAFGRKGGTQFCSCYIKYEHIRVHLPLVGVVNELKPEWSTNPNYKWGYYKIESMDEVDEKLMDWIREAYKRS